MQIQDDSTPYQIRVKGHLDERWLRWFEGLNVSQQPDGETAISGPMDQATLHGVLNRIRDLGLELISVQRHSTENNNNPIDSHKRKM